MLSFSLNLNSTVARLCRLARLRKVITLFSPCNTSFFHAYFIISNDLLTDYLLYISRSWHLKQKVARKPDIQVLRSYVFCILIITKLISIKYHLFQPHSARCKYDVVHIIVFLLSSYQYSNTHSCHMNLQL